MRRHCAGCGQLFDPYEVDADGRTRYCSDRCCYEGERDRDEDDGLTYGDPRDARDERRHG